jgi:hypothetical protein
MEELGEWSRDGGENSGRGRTVDAGEVEAQQPEPQLVALAR